VASIVHLACHGVQDVNDPLNSGFVLSDGRLMLSDLMDLDIKEAQLAVLSACETAKGDRNMPDQVVHLAAGMMFAGFTSIVGTLWYVP
jgi:CHAT domain-containing protein